MLKELAWLSRKREVMKFQKVKMSVFGNNLRILNVSALRASRNSSCGRKEPIAYDRKNHIFQVFKFVPVRAEIRKAAWFKS